MVKLIGQDVDSLLNPSKAKIAPSTKSISFSEEVVASLKDGDAIKVTNQENQKYLVIGGVVLLALLGTGLFIYYQKNKKKEKELKNKNGEIDKLNIDRKKLLNYVGEYENYFEEAKKRNAFKPVEIIKKKRTRTNPYLRS